MGSYHSTSCKGSIGLRRNIAPDPSALSTPFGNAERVIHGVLLAAHACHLIKSKFKRETGCEESVGTCSSKGDEQPAVIMVGTETISITLFWPEIPTVKIYRRGSDDLCLFESV
ncbi:hypothetical protein EG329_010318 [Mollisiaceae sp. DMI_Dod_QoI]|nr:hypothetical protein EG329_010318 [Helotiales sp. DMI_Dod_QoI]